MLGPPGKERTVWAACLFADPVADIAVLGSPDDQTLSKQAQAYQELVSQAEPLAMRPCREQEEGWLFALDQSHWFRSTVGGIQQNLWIADAAEPIRGGMSGSPILAADGTAIGLVSTASGSGDDESFAHGGPNPGYSNLPGWLLSEFARELELTERA